MDNFLILSILRTNIKFCGRNYIHAEYKAMNYTIQFNKNC